MNISKLVTHVKTPKLYEQGSSVMWTDSHISKQLLDIHLNTHIELASRSISTIETTVNWILEQVPQKQLNILDLGCGPGLYCERLAQKGHTVEGIDFSESSINYAQSHAAEQNLAIDYKKGNYCELDFGEDKYDLVILIFTDLGVLSPEDRETVLTSVYKALKPGGKFVFDLLHESCMKKQVSPKEWEVEESGFWKDAPYVHLGESILYEEAKVVLSQHIVFDNEGDDEVDAELYRFWTHFFNQEMVAQLLGKAGFEQIETFSNVIPANAFFDENDVMFSSAVK